MPSSTYCSSRGCVFYQFMRKKNEPESWALTLKRQVWFVNHLTVTAVREGGGVVINHFLFRGLD